MLMYAPSSTEKTPVPYQTTRVFDDEALLQKEVERLGKRHTRLNRFMAGFALTAVLTSPVNVYMNDVRANQHTAALSTPEIDPIQNSVEHEPTFSDVPIFYLAGFDTPNGGVFGEKLSIALHQIRPGEDFSIDYGNAPLSFEEIATQIVDEATETGIDTISLAGNSQGGIAATEVAKIIVRDSDIQVEALYLNATPTGLETLRPETRENYDKLMLLLQLPDSEYSSFARYAATMAQGIERFTNGDSLFENIDDFVKVSNETIELIQEKQRPGMWLIADQAHAIINADIEGSLSSIGEVRGEKRMPYIVTMRPKNPLDDTVVDVEKASDAICNYADNADLQCKIVLVENSPHTSWDFNTDAFTEAIASNREEIVEGINYEDIAFSMSRSAVSATGIIPPED